MFYAIFGLEMTRICLNLPVLPSHSSRALEKGGTPDVAKEVHIFGGLQGRFEGPAASGLCVCNLNNPRATWLRQDDFLNVLSS